MSGWAISIELTPSEVRSVLDAMPNEGFYDLDDAVSISFGDEKVVYIHDADPDSGTDLIIKDRSNVVAPRLYAFLDEHTAAYMWMTDDGGEVVAERGSPADGSPTRLRG